MLAQYPEVEERQIFFVSLRSKYTTHEELTASYGKEYHRFCTLGSGLGLRSGVAHSLHG